MTAAERPYPTSVFHFTHTDHMATIVANGLVSDNLAREYDLLRKEAGNREIKEARRRQAVPCGPGGVVADYVPFYYNPRSPMLYAIHKGNVPTFTEPCDNLVFLVSSTQRLRELGLEVVGSDRNARMDIADFSDDDDEIARFTRWDVIKLRYWNDAPDGGELRQAECLVHERVPWAAVQAIATMTDGAAALVREVLDDVAASARPPLTVRPGWYF